MKNGYRRTSLKVKMRNGLQIIERTVYEMEDGKHFFKFEGEHYPIWQDEKGAYKTRWFKGLEYIQ